QLVLAQAPAQARDVQVLGEEDGEQERKADDLRPGRLRYPLLERGSPGVRDRERQALARPGLARLDEASLVQHVELAVDLASGQVPEVPDRRLRALLELPAGHRPPQEKSKEGGGRGVQTAG